MKKALWRFAVVYPALLSLGVGLIAGCAQEKPPAPRPAAALPPLPPPPPRRVLSWGPIPLPQKKPSPPSQTAVQAPPPDLVGLDEQAATRLLGPADQEIERPPAVVWRYKADSCELDLYFYLDVESGRMRTLRYTSKSSGPESRGACVTTILQRNSSVVKNAAPPPR